MKKSFLLFFSIISLHILPAPEVVIETLPLGSTAPDFRLPATDGRHYTLADFSQFPILAIILLCNHCHTVQAYETRIIELVKEYRPKGVGFVSISPNNPDAVSLSELGYSDLNDESTI